MTRIVFLSSPICFFLNKIISGSVFTELLGCYGIVAELVASLNKINQV